MKKLTILVLGLLALVSLGGCVFVDGPGCGRGPRVHVHGGGHCR